MLSSADDTVSSTDSTAGTANTASTTGSTAGTIATDATGGSGGTVDVVVVGAGAAGLAAAHRLTRAGLSVAVLEAEPWIGGRMATASVDGFLLDRVGPCSPCRTRSCGPCRGSAASRCAPFAPGVLVHSDGRYARWGAPHPRRTAGVPRATGARSVGSVQRGARPRERPRHPSASLDQARLGASLVRLAATPAQRILARPERTAREALDARLPARTVQGCCGRCSRRSWPTRT